MRLVFESNIKAQQNGNSVHKDAEVRNSRQSQDVHKEGCKCVTLKTDKANQWTDKRIQHSKAKG